MMRFNLQDGRAFESPGEPAVLHYEPQEKLPKLDWAKLSKRGWTAGRWGGSLAVFHGDVEAGADDGVRSQICLVVEGEKIPVIWNEAS